MGKKYTILSYFLNIFLIIAFITPGTVFTLSWAGALQQKVRKYENLFKLYQKCRVQECSQEQKKQLEQELEALRTTIMFIGTSFIVGTGAAGTLFFVNYYHGKSGTGKGKKKGQQRLILDEEVQAKKEHKPTEQLQNKIKIIENSYDLQTPIVKALHQQAVQALKKAHEASELQVVKKFVQNGMEALRKIENHPHAKIKKIVKEK